MHNVMLWHLMKVHVIDHICVLNTAGAGHDGQMLFKSKRQIKTCKETKAS